MPTSTSRHAARLAVAVLLVALASGCTGGAKGSSGDNARAGGSGTDQAQARNAKPNGLEKKPAAQVRRDTAAALKSAKSVHVVMSGPNQPVQMDLRIQGNASTGTIGTGGAKLQITSVGSDTYLKGDQRALQMLGIAAAVRQRVGDRWIRVPAQQAGSLAGFSVDSLVGGLTRGDSPLQPKVEQATLDGRKVVVLTQRNGAKLYIANTGPAYLLRTANAGPNAGRVDLSEFGVDFHITAPSGAVDLDQLR
jgi:hypothetical protein